MNLPASLIIIDDQRYLLHDTGGCGHPEIPARLQAIRQAVEQSDSIGDIRFFPPQPAVRDYLTLAHNENWLFRFEESVLSGKTFIDHTDNQISYDSYEIACLAAGAGITAVDLLENQETNNVFCLVRPPGHHAEHSYPFGFCFFNNCVVTLRYWQEKYAQERIVVFDFDAHHGNGIQSAFEEEAGNFYISIHEHPSFSYPGTGYGEETGIGEGKGSILNIPLSPGSGRRELDHILASVIPEKLEEWQPQAIIVAAGFDAHKEDDMSGLSYSTELYESIGREVKTWADIYTDGKIISILEGGYEISVLGESVESYLRGTLGR